MKQRTKAVSANIKRFNSRINQFQQNNQGRFFQRLNNEEENHPYEIPNSVEAQTFWRGTWSERKEHHKDAEWWRTLRRMKVRIRLINKRQIDESNEKDAKLESSWSWQCPRLLVKEFNSITWQLSVFLQDYLDSWVVPDWLKKGRTVLIQKDKAKGDIATNYRPTKCLLLVWKLLTGILLAGEIYDYLEENFITRETEGDKWSFKVKVYYLSTKWYLGRCKWERKT